MNERIKELAEQAGIEFDDDFSLEPETIYYLKLSDFEKFAKLIIAECIDQVEVFNARMDAGPRHIVEAIKQHFGVKE